MKNPPIKIRTAVIHCAATAAQTLPEAAVAVLVAEYQNTNAAAGSPLLDTALPVVSGAPGANQLQFAGSALAPSNQVLLNAAATAGMVLFVRYVPQGAIPSAA